MTTFDSTIWPPISESESQTIGADLHRFATELFPLHRAITGEGLRATLNAVAKRIPIQTRSVPTGTQVLDWSVPQEWSIRQAYVQHPSGHKLIDIQKSNLHIVSYSIGVDKQMLWSELSPYLHSLPEQPEWIPYRTAHFQSRWGFCLSQEHRTAVTAENIKQPLRVFIDADQYAGELNYGELLISGQRPEEFLISTHICHPSLANDNLTGIVVATELARQLAMQPPLPISFRFLFLPATIGAITWLGQNSDAVRRIRGGLVLSNLGDHGKFTYKTSRQQTALIDRITKTVLEQEAVEFQIRDFTPWGYDERQYCSPGFNLPIGRLTRTPEGEYRQYHTSADDLSFICAESLTESLSLVKTIVAEFTRSAHWQQGLKDAGNLDAGFALMSASDLTSPGNTRSPAATNLPRSGTEREVAEVPLEPNQTFINVRPFGEPRLDQFGLYRGYGEDQDLALKQAVLWMLNLCDGKNCFADIAIRSGLDPVVLNLAAQKLVYCGLLQETS